jgi:hypothetical protein
MDLCALEDAFPNIGDSKDKSGTPFVGGKDSYSSREERRAARKRAKKMKEVALKYSNSVVEDIPDPDRPAVERMAPVDSVQQEREGFALPVLPKASCLFSDTGVPNYFGKWAEDEDEAEPFSNFNPSPTDDANYRLFPDFTKSDTLKGVEKAASNILPEPALVDNWKPMSPPTTYTAFFKDVTSKPSPVKQAKATGIKEWTEQGSKGPTAVNDTKIGNNQDDLMKRIDELIGRIDELEKKNVQDSQTEILMFVGTGLFILMSFEIFARR